MRAISACFLFAVAASLVTAQTCVAPSTNLFAAPANCVAANTCKSALCACTGSSAAYPTCLSTNTGSCTATQACYASYTSCIMSIVATRSNTSDACSTFGANLYIAQLAAAASTTLTFNTTSLAVSCSYNACSLMNQTRNTGSCVLNSITTAVCSSANLVGSVTTTTTVVPTPTPTATNATNYTGYDLVFTLRISGSSWGVLLQNAATKAQTITALTADLAKLWGIDAKWIVIQSLDVGSLVAGVGVLQGSGFSPLQLALVISATQNTGSWLTSLQAVYSTVSGETLITLAVTITVTAAPTTITPVMTLTPATAAPVVSSAVNVARVWAAAALSALCLALWA